MTLHKMSQSIPENPFQEQDNLIKDTNVGGDLNFAPVQVNNQIDNQTVNNITNCFSDQSLSSEAQIRSSKLIKGSPYLGLEKFDVEDSDKFFGRDRWIVELTNYLEKENVLLLLGASGSGKSSLIQAGLIPKLKDQWSSQLFNFTFVPDVDPFESFYTSLYTKYQSKATLAKTVQEDTLIKVVELLKKEDIQWLIFIDQFEELFTRTPQNERDVFVKSLIQLIDKNDPTAKLVMTMRADFLDKFTPYPALGRIHDHHSRMLTDMEDGDLRLAIAKPAARNGVTFEEGLINEIVTDFKQRAGSLPLLQYTLDLLWKNDDIQDRVLNKETYKKLGGVTGALQQQADKIYNELDDSERKAANHVFLELIALEGREPVSRRVEQSIFSGDSLQVSVLSKLIDNRLLVSKVEDGKAKVEVAHEELLRSWKVLQGLIQEKEAVIILRTRLEEDANNWQKLCQENSPEARGYLLNGPRLNRIINLYKDQSLTNLNSVTRNFIRASWEYRQQLQKAEAERKQREIDSELSLANSLGRYSLSLFNEGKELDAFIEAIRAGKILQKHKAHSSTVLAALQKVFYEGGEINRLEGHSKTINSESISPNGKILASGSNDNTIKLWNLYTGQEIRTLTGHNYAVYEVCISPNGQILASVSTDYTIKIWNIDTGQEIDTLTDYKEKSDIKINFSSDGKILCISYKSSSVNISPDWQISFISDRDRPKIIEYWNLKIDKEISLNKLDSNTNISQNEEISTSSHDNKTIEFWNPAIKKTLIICKEDRIIKLLLLQKNINQKMDIFIGHTQVIYSVSISQDGKILASGSGDRTIKLWDLATGKEIQTFQHHESVISVRISPDAKTLISVGERTIKKWDLDKKDEIFTFQRNLESIIRVSVSPDSKTLAYSSVNSKTITLVDIEENSVSPDSKTLAYSSVNSKTITLVDIEENKEIFMTGHDDAVNNVDISSDGKILVSSSFYNIVKLWDLETNTQIETLTIETLTKDNFFTITSVNISFDRKTVATGRADGRITFWNVNTKKEIITIQGHQKEVSSVNFSPDGKRLASGDTDGNIKLWSFDLDFLMKESCDLVRNYLTYNPNVSESDRHLCDGIATKQ